ncbi:hypothetical protein [Knoellia sp. Soil729]|uniref:hypothetical protein n=1 Tax=Knoellia sp. Soil729 TaxID=1736394 RepID=UPI00070100D0|nr:hypothetical protein [Knoellia sp. Soil729]KRE41894.1 hypothetical protein ASG74_05255 [Knoellia sp. Soil729]
MDDVIRTVLIAIAVLLGLFLVVVALLMWRNRILPRGWWPWALPASTWSRPSASSRKPCSGHWAWPTMLASSD